MIFLLVLPKKVLEQIKKLKYGTGRGPSKKLSNYQSLLSSSMQDLVILQSHRTGPPLYSHTQTLGGEDQFCT